MKYPCKYQCIDYILFDYFLRFFLPTMRSQLSAIILFYNSSNICFRIRLNTKIPFDMFPQTIPKGKISRIISFILHCLSNPVFSTILEIPHFDINTIVSTWLELMEIMFVSCICHSVVSSVSIIRCFIILWRRGWWMICCSSG